MPTRKMALSPPRFASDLAEELEVEDEDVLLPAVDAGVVPEAVVEAVAALDAELEALDAALEADDIDDIEELAEELDMPEDEDVLLPLPALP